MLAVAAAVATVTAACGGEVDPDPDVVARDEQLYAASCVQCHGGPAGGQISDIPPRHNAEGHTWHHADCLLTDIVLDGLPPRQGASDDEIMATPVVSLLRAHRERQDQPRRRAGVAWQEHDLVFTNEVGRYLYPDYVSTKFSLYARECGLPHIGGPHGLRHSLASALDANGSGLATISALLGHASTAVTSKVYTHMLKGADRTAVDAHAAALFAARDEDGEDLVANL